MSVPALRATRLGPARLLGVYFDAHGRERSAIAIARPDASVLVLDCLSAGLRDARLIGHIACEEPVRNPRLLARMYLSDPSRSLPRRLSREDLRVAERPVEEDLTVTGPAVLCDAAGASFSIGTLADGGQLPELRWIRTHRQSSVVEPVSVRDTLAALERYEPPRTLTRQALHSSASTVSVVRLRSELQRIERSPIVLNRGLREAVQQALAHGASLSEIALRCGRTKSDAHGNRSGETSWLARRIGLMPEAGRAHPTTWVHSDTLALIARDGLGVSPREVEL